MDAQTIGHNGFRYRVQPGWGTLDAARHPVKDCHEVVLDRRGRIFLLTNETRNNVLVYNKDGKLLTHWGHDYPGAHGLTLVDEGGEEFLYLADFLRHEVVKTTLDGRVVQTLGFPAESGLYQSAAEFKPTETAVNPTTGDVYVTDGYGWQTVTRYDRQGRYVQHWGGWPSRQWPTQTEADQDAPFHCAHGVALDTRPGKTHDGQPTLLITSRNHNRFRRYTLDGQWLADVVLPGSFVCRPVIHGPNVYAAVFRSGTNKTENSGYLQILDADDRVVSTPGGTEPVYDDAGRLREQRQAEDAPFLHPHDVAADEDGNLYVAQWNSGGTYPIRLERIP